MRQKFIQILNSKNIDTLGLIAFITLAIAFFIISRCGFFVSDDYAMNAANIREAIDKTIYFYKMWSGQVFSIFTEFIFCRVTDYNKIWFDIFNTIFFVITIIICSGISTNGHVRNSWFHIAIFSLAFWFLCPIPWQTLFWVVGSIAYLWTNSLCFIFLYLFVRYKDKNSPILTKTILFFASIFLSSSLIPCVSICGAFVVYYIFHLKELRGNNIPMIIGFTIGAIFVFFAPGNFMRAAVDTIPFIDKLIEFFSNPPKEIGRYFAPNILFLLWIYLYIQHRSFAFDWVKKNAFLLIVLGWSAIAFSIVFRPEERGAFFTETMSIILLLRLIYAYIQSGLPAPTFVSKIRSKLKFLNKKFLLSSIFIMFLCDSGLAIKETLIQKENNAESLKCIIEGGGLAAVDEFTPAHRMAICPSFPSWSWKGISKYYGLKRVRTYPYYCMEKYYTKTTKGDIGYCIGRHCVIIRLKKTDGGNKKPIVFHIKHTPLRRNFPKLLNKILNKEFSESVISQERESPDITYKDYDYYYIWTEANLKRSKNISVEIEKK